MCALHPPKSARGAHGWLCPRVVEWGWGGAGCRAGLWALRAGGLGLGWAAWAPTRGVPPRRTIKAAAGGARRQESCWRPAGASTASPSRCLPRICPVLAPRVSAGLARGGSGTSGGWGCRGRGVGMGTGLCAGWRGNNPCIPHGMGSVMPLPCKGAPHPPHTTLLGHGGAVGAPHPAALPRGSVSGCPQASHHQELRWRCRLVRAPSCSPWCCCCAGCCPLHRSRRGCS